MDPVPAEIRAAADVVYRAASFVTLAFEEVGPWSDGDTWQGPAAEAFRDGYRRADGGVRGVAGGLRDVAARLEARADQLQAALRAAEDEAERARAGQEACRQGLARTGGVRLDGRGLCPSPVPWGGDRPVSLSVDLGMLAREPGSGGG